MSRCDQLETRVGIGPITNDQVYECRYRLSLLHSLLLIAEHWHQVPFPLYCIMMYSPGLPRARLCRLSLEPLALGKLWGCNAKQVVIAQAELTAGCANLYAAKQRGGLCL